MGLLTSHSRDSLDSGPNLGQFRRPDPANAVRLSAAKTRIDCSRASMTKFKEWAEAVWRGEIAATLESAFRGESQVYRETVSALLMPSYWQCLLLPMCMPSRPLKAW